eukprot:5879329-Amphidinium_carterae.2
METPLTLAIPTKTLQYHRNMKNNAYKTAVEHNTKTDHPYRRHLDRFLLSKGTLLTFKSVRSIFSQ